jgi:hypothetical protein
MSITLTTRIEYTVIRKIQLRTFLGVTLRRFLWYKRSFCRNEKGRDVSLFGHETDELKVLFPTFRANVDLSSSRAQRITVILF